jgi:hypothetical protein
MTAGPGASPILRGLRIGLAVLAAVGVVGWDLPTLLAHLDRYRPAALAVGGYVALLAVAAAALWLAVRDVAPPAAVRAALAAVVLAACTAATAAVPAADLLGPAHWSWELAAWFFAALLADVPLRWTALAVAAHLGLVAGQLAAADRLDHRTLVAFAVVVVLNSGGALALAAGGGFVRRVGGTAARTAAQERELATANRIAGELHADRRRRYADVATTLVPLLEGLRDGTLSPADPAVRRRCAVESARLRRLLAEGDDVPDALAHELRACADAAQRAGVAVQLSVCGEGPPPALPVRRALADPVTALLAGARTAARVTLVRTATQTVVSVVADADARPAADGPPVAAAPDVTVDLRPGSGGGTWLTVTWAPA